MKNVNTLRVEGNGVSLVTTENSDLYIYSKIGLWSFAGYSILAALIVTVLVHMILKYFYKSMRLTKSVIKELDGVETLIHKKVDLIYDNGMKSVLRLTGQVDLIHQNIAENIQSEFEPMRLEINQLKEAFSQLKLKAEGTSLEFAALSERLNQHMDRIDPLEIKDIDLTNQF